MELSDESSLSFSVCLGVTQCRLDLVLILITLELNDQDRESRFHLGFNTSLIKTEDKINTIHYLKRRHF